MHKSLLSVALGVAEQKQKAGLNDVIAVGQTRDHSKQKTGCLGMLVLLVKSGKL